MLSKPSRSFIVKMIGIKTFLTCTIVLLQCRVPPKNLPVKEKIFILQHQPSKSIQKKLDLICKNMPKVLQQLINGERNCASKQEIFTAFTNSGFQVYVLIMPNESIRGKKRKRTVHAIVRHNTLPEFFLKFGFDWRYPQITLCRILVADFINRILSLSIPQSQTLIKIEKKLYHRPTRNWDLLDVNYIVLSPTIDAKPLTCFTDGKQTFLEPIHQEIFEKFQRSRECTLFRTLLGPSWDCTRPSNFLIDKDKLYNIDTEPNINKNLHNINIIKKYILGKAQYVSNSN